MGGTQSLHTNGYDEALSLPTEEAARIALRTQQIIATESGVVDTVDPLAGSYFIETLTDEIEAKANEYIDRIDAMGGSVSAIEAGFMQNEIASASYMYQRAVQNKERIIVGVNQYVIEEPAFDKHFTIDDSIRNLQINKLDKLKAERDQKKVDDCIRKIEQAAKDGTNLMPVIIDAVENLATLGEVADAMRRIFGEYK